MDREAAHPTSTKRKRRKRRKPKKKVTLSARVLAFLGAVILAFGTAIGGAFGDVLKDLITDVFRGPPKTDVTVEEVEVEHNVSRAAYIRATQGPGSSSEESGSSPESGRSFPRQRFETPGMVVYAQVHMTGYEGMELQASPRVFTEDQERVPEIDGAISRHFIPFSDDDSRTIDVWVPTPSDPGRYIVELSVFRTNGGGRHRIGSDRGKFSVRAPVTRSSG